MLAAHLQLRLKSLYSLHPHARNVDAIGGCDGDQRHQAPDQRIHVLHRTVQAERRAQRPARGQAVGGQQLSVKWNRIWLKYGVTRQPRLGDWVGNLRLTNWRCARAIRVVDNRVERLIEPLPEDDRRRCFVEGHHA